MLTRKSPPRHLAAAWFSRTNATALGAALPFRSSRQPATLVGHHERIRRMTLRAHHDERNRSRSANIPQPLPPRRNHTRGGVALASFLRSGAGPATTTEEERLQILTDPDAIRKKLEKERNRPPFEFFRSQVAPFDILPYVKPNHWFTITFELRANDDNYDGILQTEPVKLVGMPHEMSFLREGRLIKEQRRRRAVQMMVPDGNRNGSQNLRGRPGSQRCIAARLDLASESVDFAAAPDAGLDPEQRVDDQVRRLGKALGGAARFGRARRGDLEKLRYYRLVLPIEPDSVSLSSHPLTWTTMSHVIWDNYSPDSLSVSQQQAMLDWLHWGGQIVLCGGAGQTFSVLRDSFLGPIPSRRSHR